jgi:hypothetical protein
MIMTRLRRPPVRRSNRTESGAASDSAVHLGLDLHELRHCLSARQHERNGNRARLCEKPFVTARITAWALIDRLHKISQNPRPFL